ncbi:MAG: YraN family protein [Opitutaceae bacterium]|nr:YraN family protein [Opitutaceae bacterium]
MWRFLQSLLSPSRPPDPGALGEQCAAAWLRRERRIVVVATNWRNPRDRREEIDLVGRDGEVLVFVEVKTRAPGALVPGYYAVDARKRRVLQRAIRAYLQQLREKPRTFRFDIVEVVLAPGAAAPREILHFENVPLFPKGFRGGG